MTKNMKTSIRVGIDVHICRTVGTGLYTFIWNIIDRLGSLPRAPDLTLILYGPDKFQESELIAHMQRSFGITRFKNFWTKPKPWIRTPTTTAVQGRATQARTWIERNLLLRLWRKLAFGATGKWNTVLSPLRRGRTPPWWNELDVLHHTAGLLLPMHPRANVLTINDLIPHHFKHAYKYSFAWYGESFERAREMDGILVYSEHTKADVVAELGIDPARIQVVPLAAHRRFRPIDDVATIERVTEKYGVTNQGYVLHVGSLESRKNLVRLVEAFYELTVLEPTLRHKLVFSGPRYTPAEPIFEAIENLGLQDRVLSLGAVPFDDLPILMNGAVVLAFPSVYEGFGLPPLEAMACGVPVIVANASSLPEVVGDAALLVHPYRTSEMTSALRRVLTEPNLRERMRENGLKRAALFSWDRSAELTLALYENAIEHSRQRQRDPSLVRANVPARPMRNEAEINNWLFDQMSEQLFKTLKSGRH